MTAENRFFRKAVMGPTIFGGNSPPPQSWSQWLIFAFSGSPFFFGVTEVYVTKNSIEFLLDHLIMSFVWIPFLLFEPIPWLVINQLLSHSPLNVICRDKCPTLKLSTITTANLGGVLGCILLFFIMGFCFFHFMVVARVQKQGTSTKCQYCTDTYLLNHEAKPWGFWKKGNP